MTKSPDEIETQPPASSDPSDADGGDGPPSDPPTRTESSSADPLPTPAPGDGTARFGGPVDREAVTQPLAAIRARMGASNPGTDPLTELGDPDPAFRRRYREGENLGRGGMGEVHVLHDERLDREVAIKRALPALLQKDRSHLELFLREARIQGRLDHPSVVPVHDLGVDAAGLPYFTMKRVKGTSLSRIIAARRDRSPEDTGLGRVIGRGRLLRALAQVALALEYAHRAGFVHRDLKPENLMLGDFGEVYVLDWGLAGRGKIRSERELTGFLGDDKTITPIGTPGYAAPEQVEQDHDSVGPRSDVWGLGAVLFEILAEERFIDTARGPEVTLMAMKQPHDPRPSVRRPDLDVAPELDAICARALDWDPSRRFGSAREFHDALEDFLDGERDASLRQETAHQHADEATRLARRSLEVGGEEALAAQTGAMQSIRTALGLDPSNEQALETLMSLMQHPPKIVPAAVEAELETSRRDDVRSGLRVGGWAGLASVGSLVVACLGLGVLNPVLLAIIAGLSAVTCGAALHASRPGQGRVAHEYVYFLGTMLIYMLLSRMAGPVMFVPALYTCIVMGAASTHRLRDRAVFVGVGVVAFWTPILTELAGVLPQSYDFSGGTMKVVPHLAAMPGPSSVLLLLGLAGTLCIVGGSAFSGALREDLNERELASAMQRWQLRQLLTVPTDGGPGTGPLPRTGAVARAGALARTGTAAGGPRPGD